MATLTLASNPGGGTLAGTTSVAFNQGVATFTGLSPNRAAPGYQVQASTPGLTSVPSSNRGRCSFLDFTGRCITWP